MDTFDAFLTNTDCFQADPFPSDLREVEPLLSDAMMDVDPLGLFDVNFNDVRDDPFFSEDFKFENNQNSSDSSKSSSTSDLSSEKSIQHTVDLVNFDHNYAASPRLYDDGVLATSREMQKSETSISFPSLQETCYVGVEDTSTSFFDSLFSSDVFKTEDDVMWSSYSSGTSTGDFSPASTNVEDEEQINEQISSKFPEPGFHESSINELAKKHIEAQLPNFKPIVLTDEEKALLIEEGVTLPTDLPLTRSEERVLKKVRRKIRNKRSAKVSRQKKKDYIEGLEWQISESNGLNRTLSRRVDELQKKNATLQQQLRRLMTYVKLPIHKTTQATPCLLVLMLSIGLFLTPFSPGQDAGGNVQVPSGHRTRKVLEFKTINEQHSYLVQWFHQMVNVYNHNQKLQTDVPGIEPFKDLPLANQEMITKPEKLLKQPPDCKNSTEEISKHVSTITLTAQSLTKENRPNSSTDEFLDDKKLNLKTTTFVPPKDEANLFTLE